MDISKQDEDVEEFGEEWRQRGLQVNTNLLFIFKTFAAGSLNHVQ